MNKFSQLLFCFVSAVLLSVCVSGTVADLPEYSADEDLLDSSALFDVDLADSDDEDSDVESEGTH